VTTLLIHPADDPEVGPWTSAKWSRIIDLGLGGSKAYERWTDRFGCPVLPIDGMRRGLEEVYRVRDVIAKGLGKLIDRSGVDWWEMMATDLPGPLEILVLLRKVAQSLDANEEVHVTRAGFHASALRQMLGNRVHTFDVAAPSSRGPMRYLKAARKFPAWQLLQIFWDKNDPDLDIRRRFARRTRSSDMPVVLIPSGYVNVTRTGLDYARTAPGLKFLLVATRRSAWVEGRPSNVRGEWLASYAAQRDEGPLAEYEEILAKWRCLREELETEPEISLAGRLGLLDDFPRYFRVGWKVRGTWEVVFQRERIQSVLCADDSNLWTRLPLLLARKYGVPAVACHHGALDSQRIFKQNAADVVLTKGDMERDYVVRVCGVPPAEVVVGAPARIGEQKRDLREGAGGQPLITFFSEPYETFSGRGEEFYRDVLPALADLAVQTGKKVVVKLHPAESRSERDRMIDTLLTTAQREVVRLVEGLTTPELLKQTWFGITVLSTVASECAVAGVPCFLCRWLEFTHHGYGDQFLRFGVGYELKTPGEIAVIPRIVETHSANPGVATAVWQTIDRAKLEEMLSPRPVLGERVEMEMQRAQ